jgi:glycosyltransferase involved in cell wall biosynthesis
MPYFSVLICSFNRANLLPRALDSLTGQIFRDFEVILIDDGSSDNTYEVFKQYQNKFEKIKYLYQKNQGLPTARNIGVKISEGKFITFLDSDDEYMPNHLQTRHKIFEENPHIDLLHGGVQVIGNKFVPDFVNPQKMISIDECIVGGTFFFTKSLFKKIDGFKMLEYGDDTDFHRRAVEINASIFRTDISTYVYHRETPDSICNILTQEIQNNEKK